MSEKTVVRDKKSAQCLLIRMNEQVYLHGPKNKAIFNQERLIHGEKSAKFCGHIQAFVNS